jgi:hypothetical protein
MEESHKMKYYYFNPFSKHFYFPEEFYKYPIFATFYEPYKVSAKLLWKLWLTSSFFRNLFSTNRPENFLPLGVIKQYVTPSSIIAFNIGKGGVEQKFSILGVDTKTNSSFFIKYATTDHACDNICNEGTVLEQLSHLEFVPKLDLYVNENRKFTLLKTSVLHGTKIKPQPINDNMLNILYDLSIQEVRSNKNYDSNLQTCFSHGDFCPWNMLIDNEKILLFDWEMAGKYPLGYDIFSYIFQFEFLVNGNVEFDQILKGNSVAIGKYFNRFAIDDWKPYLQCFANLLYEIESERKDKNQIKPYLQLKEFAAQI